MGFGAAARAVERPLRSRGSPKIPRPRDGEGETNEDVENPIIKRVDPSANGERVYHERIDPHRAASGISDLMLGGQDGLVNVLGVLLGIAEASGSSRLTLAGGLATAFAESISMAAVAYTSSVARGNLYDAERSREARHVVKVPELERDEVRAIYRKKGFDGELLERIVATITSQRDVWIAVMMSEEHGLVPVSRRKALRSAVVVGVAAMVGSLIPVMPFFFVRVHIAMWGSVGVAAVALFALGAYKARLTIGHPGKSGLELAMIGIVSALAGYVVGVLFGVSG
jgi:VIT1/CCC1 family predicted Fe2+/Mn2+ transporter